MACILELQGITQNSRQPLDHTGAMEIALLAIGTTPEDGRILQELATEKAPVPDCGQVKGIVFTFCDPMGDHVLFIWTGKLQLPLL
jgi:hypothetical protein